MIGSGGGRPTLFANGCHTVWAGRSADKRNSAWRAERAEPRSSPGPRPVRRVPVGRLSPFGAGRVPGDPIFTGRPGTTTATEDGDVVELELEGVGVLRDAVRPEGAPSRR